VFKSSSRSTFFKLTGDPELGFRLDHGLHVRLPCYNQGQDVQKPVSAKPGL